MQRAASRPMRPSTSAVPILRVARPSAAPLRRTAAPVRRALPAMAGPNDVQWSLNAVRLLQKYGLDQPAAMKVVGKLNARLPSSKQLKAMLTKDDIVAAVQAVVKRQILVSRLETRIQLLLLACLMVFTTQPAVAALLTTSS